MGVENVNGRMNVIFGCDSNIHSERYGDVTMTIRAFQYLLGRIT